MLQTLTYIHLKKISFWSVYLKVLVRSKNSSILLLRNFRLFAL